MTNKSMSDDEITALKFAGRYDRPVNTATHWFAGACGYGKDTAKARRLLLRLQKRGLVKGVKASRTGRVFWWCITEAGRDALSGMKCGQAS